MNDEVKEKKKKKENRNYEKYSNNIVNVLLIDECWMESARHVNIQLQSGYEWAVIGCGTYKQKPGLQSLRDGRKRW